MDSFEFNKVAGAVLFTLLLIMGVGILAEFLYAPPELEQQAYVVELPEAEDAAHGAEEQQAEAEPLAVVLAAGDAAKGASVAKKCAACHNFEAGQPNKIGPNLHGVVGRQMASAPGFAYSDAIREHGASGDSWTYENLYAFLEAPKSFMPGTTMAFAGLKKSGDRADMIAFLRGQSPDAPPLPVVEAAVSEGAAGAAEGTGQGADTGADEPGQPASEAMTTDGPDEAATAGEPGMDSPVEPGSQTPGGQ